jgi:sensor histidine kinase YesM
MLNQATFLALQTQTNPHFLFNTLSSISRSVTLGKKEQTLTMIDALANLLRYSLADAGEPVSLREELTVTREYLKIQTVRFRDRITAEFRVDEDIAAEARLPRFTLQPLVENAIIHGLEPKESGGRLVIAARRRGGRAVLRIFDDGNGIPEDKLRMIRERKSQSLSKRIGIWNTQKRIALFTHSDRCFDIVSRKQGGTLVTIRLPLKEGSDA